jgi:hypothetical protein
MDNSRKKDLIREYKERKRSAGIFAVRCTATDEVWVGPSRNLDKEQNSLWFQLRMNGHMNKTMQAAWNAHGEAGFAYEVLEEIADDNPQLVGLLLKERDAKWREQLGAAKAAV